MSLICKNLEIGYQQKNKVKSLITEINLHLNPGELVGIMGTNGAGKSTFLKTVSKNIKPLSGNIFIDNQNLINFDLQNLSTKLSFINNENKVAFNPILYEYIRIGRIPFVKWHNQLTEKDIKKINHSIELVNMEEFKNRKINNLSDGERQKAAIARALCQDTDIILMDEPTAFLDVKNKFEIMKLVRNLCNSEKKLIIFSTHDIDLAIQFSDKLIILNQNMCEYGSPEDLIINNKLTQLYNSESIFFEKSELRFRIKKKPNKYWKIKNNADDFHLKLTENALRRFSLLPNLNTNNVEICIFNNHWEIKHNQETIKITTIENLMAKLKEIVLT